MLNVLLNEYCGQMDMSNGIRFLEMKRLLKAEDIDKFFENIKTIFAGIPYEMFMISYTLKNLQNKLILYIKILGDSLFFLLTLCIISYGEKQSKILLTITGYQLKAEIAGTLSKKIKGLMHRKSLAEDEGMLFVYKISQHISFWMKDTYIPLSLAFIDKNGIITEIIDLKPFDKTIYRSKYRVKYALEVNQGWFKKRKVEAGTKIKELY